MIAVAFPETEAFFVQQHEAANPFDTFPGVKVRHDEAKRPAVFGGKRYAIVIESEENIGAQQIFQRNICGVTLFGEDQHVFCFGLGLNQLQHFAEEHALFDVDERCALKLGDTVEVVPGYAPTTVNLYDAYHVVENDVVVDIWPIVPRGPGHFGTLTD